MASCFQTACISCWTGCMRRSCVFTAARQGPWRIRQSSQSQRTYSSSFAQCHGQSTRRRCGLRTRQCMQLTLNSRRPNSTNRTHSHAHGVTKTYEVMAAKAARIYLPELKLFPALGDDMRKDQLKVRRLTMVSSSSMLIRIPVIFGCVVVFSTVVEMYPLVSLHVRIGITDCAWWCSARLTVGMARGLRHRAEKTDRW